MPVAARPDDQISAMPSGIPVVWPTEIHLSADAPRKWIQVAKTGSFFSRRYGKFSITPDDLKSMLNNFRTITPISPTQLPVDYDHLSMDPKQVGDGKAAGWFTGPMELRDNDTTLWAEVEFTPPAAESIKRKEYRFVSPSFVRDYVWKNGKNIGTTLIAAAITNHPFLEGMEALTLSNDLGELAVSIDLTTTGMKAGQIVAVAKESARAPRDESLIGKKFEIVEVAGAGNDAFALLKDDEGTELGWYRANELEPAPAEQVPATSETPPPVPAAPNAANPAVPAPPVPAQLSEDKMADVVFNLRDAAGKEVTVKDSEIQSFFDEQLKAAKAAAISSTVPEGSLVISASKLKEFEDAGQEVTKLRAEVTSLREDAEKAEKNAYTTALTARLDTLSKEGKLTKPQRDWAAKTFADPVALSAFEEWEKTLTPVVNLNAREHGSSVGTEGASPKPSGELLVLAQARAKERGIDLRTAISQVASERTDLSTQYRESFSMTNGRAEKVTH